LLLVNYVDHLALIRYIFSLKYDLSFKDFSFRDKDKEIVYVPTSGYGHGGGYSHGGSYDHSGRRRRRSPEEAEAVADLEYSWKLFEAAQRFDTKDCAKKLICFLNTRRTGKV